MIPREQRLIRLSSLLLENNLIIEASLVANLSSEIYKDAGITETISNIKDYLLSVDPEIIEYISLGIKISGALVSLTGAGAAAGAAIVKASSGTDIYAAILNYKNNNIFSAILNIISAIMSVPSGMLNKFYSFLFSESFVKLTSIFTKLSRGLINTDRSALIVVRLFEFFEKLLPAIFDGLITLIDMIKKQIISFSGPIAAQLMVKKDDVDKRLGAELSKMSGDIRGLYSSISSI